MFTKPITREIMSHLHKGRHWVPQAMCDIISKKYGCIGIYTIAKHVTESCLTCRKIKKQASRKLLLGGRSPGLRPFQRVQVDYTEMPKVG
jgi:hypothetical protein